MLRVAVSAQPEIYHLQKKSLNKMKLSLYHRHNLPSSTGTFDNNCTSHRICIVSRTLLKSDANLTSKKKLTERSTCGKLPVEYQDQFASPIGSRSATRTQNATRNPVPSGQVIPTPRSRKARDQHDTSTPPSASSYYPNTIHSAEKTVTAHGEEPPGVHGC